MLKLVPVTLKEANQYVQAHHRHHGPVTGHRFSIGVEADEGLVGVAICGRPVSRYLDDGYTLEITRLCTDGTKNACSMLYGAAFRAAKAMGYRRVITYILDDEVGTSLVATGFICEGRAGGIAWAGCRKPQNPGQYPHQMKTRWAKYTKEAQFEHKTQ